MEFLTLISWIFATSVTELRHYHPIDDYYAKKENQNIEATFFPRILPTDKIAGITSCKPHQAFRIKKSIYIYCKLEGLSTTLFREELRTLIYQKATKWAQETKRQDNYIFIYFTDELSNRNSSWK
jgi:hypothetical protein